KADREGADRILHELRAMLELAPKKDWEVPVIKTQAVGDQGIEELIRLLSEHRRHLAQDPERAERLRQLRQSELEEILRDQFGEWLREKLARDTALKPQCDQVLSGEISAYEGALKILPKLIKK